MDTSEITQNKSSTFHSLLNVITVATKTEDSWNHIAPCASSPALFGNSCHMHSMCKCSNPHNNFFSEIKKEKQSFECTTYVLILVLLIPSWRYVRTKYCFLSAEQLPLALIGSGLVVTDSLTFIYLKMFILAWRIFSLSVEFWINNNFIQHFNDVILLFFNLIASEKSVVIHIYRHTCTHINYLYVYIYIYFIAVLWFELRAYTSSHSTSPFCVRYFQP
jgi:hypothetical protein